MNFLSVQITHMYTYFWSPLCVVRCAHWRAINCYYFCSNHK